MSKGKTSSDKKSAESKTSSKNTVAERQGFYTKKLSSRIAHSAKRDESGKYHVILGDRNQWTVVADGNIRATRVFTTKKSAIEFARATADQYKGIVIIHKENGEIEKRVSIA
jgi:hypothetical protein